MWELLREQIGSLECCIIKPREELGTPEVLAVFCHGFGAPGDDLVPVGEFLLDDQLLVKSRIAFVFPAAPLPLDPSGQSRAWWPIDLARLEALADTTDISGLSNLVPGRLRTCRELIENLLTELQARWSIPAKKTVVGGFSQGAMLATEVALQAKARPAGLVAWSGALINQTEWRNLAATGERLEVVQSHGLWDPILPFATGEALRELLIETGHSVNFVSFQGYHSIPEAALGASRQLLRQILLSGE